MKEESKTSVYNMTMMMLSEAIMFWGVGWGGEMRNTKSSEKWSESLVFTTIIGI